MTDSNFALLYQAFKRDVRTESQKEMAKDSACGRKFRAMPGDNLGAEVAAKFMDKLTPEWALVTTDEELMTHCVPGVRCSAAQTMLRKSIVFHAMGSDHHWLGRDWLGFPVLRVHIVRIRIILAFKMAEVKALIESTKAKVVTPALAAASAAAPSAGPAAAPEEPAPMVENGGEGDNKDTKGEEHEENQQKKDKEDEEKESENEKIAKAAADKQNMEAAKVLMEPLELPSDDDAKKGGTKTDKAEDQLGGRRRRQEGRLAGRLQGRRGQAGRLEGRRRK